MNSLYLILIQTHTRIYYFRTVIQQVMTKKTTNLLRLKDELPT